MPTRPLRPCTTPSCPVLVESGACKHHARVREQRRGAAGRRGYGALHRKRRVLVLARDPICRGCQRAESTVDDHIVPISIGGSAEDMDNQQGLCVLCHGYKTAVEQRDPWFGMRLREAGQVIGEPAPPGWRHMPEFGAAA